MLIMPINFVSNKEYDNLMKIDVRKSEHQTPILQILTNIYCITSTHKLRFFLVLIFIMLIIWSFGILCVQIW